MRPNAYSIQAITSHQVQVLTVMYRLVLRMYYRLPYAGS